MGKHLTVVLFSTMTSPDFVRILPPAQGPDILLPLQRGQCPSQCLASVLIAAIIAGKLQLGWHAETFQRYNNLNLCKISCAPSIMFDVSRTSDLMSKIKCWKITFRKINWVKSRIFTSRHFYLSSGSFISDKLYELVSGTVGRCGNISRTSVVLVVSSH